MSHVVDLTGMDFGYLHVIGRDTSKKGDTAHWICRCKCGTICTKDGKYLRNGHAKSCGCFRKERAATLATKKDPAKKPKAEPKKAKFGRGPQRAGSGICYNPLCPTRNNYHGAWSCTECRFCQERKFTRQSRREEEVWRKNTPNEIRAAFGLPPITPTEYTEMKIREETDR